MNLKPPYSLILLSLILINTATIAHATKLPSRDVSVTQSVEQTIERQATDIEAHQNEATRWSLSVEDYQTYLELMNSTPAGVWYATLDPMEVLGLMASTEAERQRYATLSARLHYERAERELAFQRAFEKGIKQLFPMAKPIATEHALQSGDEWLVFVDAETMPDQFLDALIAKASSETPLHIYVKGSLSKAELSDWAKHHRIPYAAVANGQISLNFDSGQLGTLLGLDATYPTLLRKRGQAYESMELPV